MTDTFDVAVVGGGVMGCATALAVAQSDRSVALFERFEVGHTRGSSHGGSRIFRFSYPDGTYVAMAQEALDLWRALERQDDEPLLETTGGFDTGKRLDDHVTALESCGAPYELLTGAEVGARWPGLLHEPGAPLLYQPDGAMIHADRAWQTFARRAAGDGARVHERTTVEAITITGDSLVLKTSIGHVTAGVVVVTAGAWSKGLLEPLGIDLDVRATRETVAYFDFPRSIFPTLVDWGSPAVYALPAPGQGLKVGEHIAGATTDPDTEGAVDEASVERLTEWVRSRFPEAAPSPHHVETCIYTNTPDEHFVLERHGNVVVGSPCSGHGFKFAPLIGRRLAGLAT